MAITTTLLVLLLLLLVSHHSQARTCTVTGPTFGFSINRDTNSLTCDGSDACPNANITGCDAVICGDRDCTGATITDSGSVTCRGESACRQATITADTVTCQGASWTCYQATITANTTIVCEDNSDEGLINQNSVCGFGTLDTPCLQCIGTNHGCGGGNGCKMNGENDCPEFRYGGTTCDAACPQAGECPINQTLPSGEKAPHSDSSRRSYGARAWWGTMGVAVVVALFNH